MVERCVRDAEAVGSNPVASIHLINYIGPIGQAVKTTPSHGVNPGSIPGLVIGTRQRYLPVSFLQVLPWLSW